MNTSSGSIKSEQITSAKRSYHHLQRSSPMQNLTNNELFELKSALHESCSYWHDVYMKVAEGKANHVTIEAAQAVINSRKKLLEHIETMQDKL